jgi:putative flippase GtrA
MIKKLSRYKQFIVYSLIGFSGVLIDLTLFYLLFSIFQIEKNTANILSTTTGITNNFLWNAFSNFKVTDKLAKRFLSFYTVGIIGILITMLIFYMFVDIFKFDTFLVKTASIFIVVFVQYNLNKTISFKTNV